MFRLDGAGNPVLWQFCHSVTLCTHSGHPLRLAPSTTLSVVESKSLSPAVLCSRGEKEPACQPPRKRRFPCAPCWPGRGAKSVRSSTSPAGSWLPSRPPTQSRRRRLRRPRRRALQNLGGRVKLHRQSRYGNILEARFGPGSGLAEAHPPARPSRHRLAARHARVHALPPAATAACGVPEPRYEGRRRHGLTAIEMLAEADLLDREIVLLLNGDEEIGSPVSRPITEQLARTAPRSTCLSRRRDWPTKPHARAPATGASMWQASPHTRVWTLRKAPTPSRRARAHHRNGERLDRPQARPDGERGCGRRRHQKQCDSRRCLGRSRRAHCSQRRRPAHREEIRRAQSHRQALLAHRHRRHQPPAHGAHAAALCGSTSKARTLAAELGFALRRSRNRRRLRRQLYRGARRSHARRHGRCRRGRARRATSRSLIEQLAPRTALLAGILPLRLLSGEVR